MERPWSVGHNGTRRVPWSVTLEASPEVVALRSKRNGPPERGRTWRRGKVTAWSRASRQRLRVALAQIEWERTSDSWLLVTLTMPGAYEGTPLEWKYQLKRFRRAWEVRWGASPSGVWVMEWQRRGAVHWHLLLAAPQSAEENVAPTDVRAWASTTWHRIVTRHKAKECVMKACVDHVRSGTHVTPATVNNASLYLAREMGKRSQKHLPEAHESEGAGRWWGLWRVERARQPTILSDDEFFVLRRVLRSLAHRRRYEFEPRYVFQGLSLFSRGARWSLSAALGRYLESRRQSGATEKRAEIRGIRDRSPYIERTAGIAIAKVGLTNAVFRVKLASA